MKKTISCLLALLSLLLCANCLKEEVPYLTISAEENIEMESGGGSFTIEVKTNQSWTAVSDADWCVIDGDGSGSYKGEFAVTVAANTDSQSRSANIIIKGGSCVASVTVIQTCDDADFSVSASTISFLNTADTYNLSISSNYPWTAVSSSSWCTLSVGSGNGDAIVEVAADANNTGEERNATITFTVKTEGKSIVRTVNVVQSADSFWLDLPLTEFAVSKGEGRIEIPYLVKGQGVEVECHSGADWITVESVKDGSALLKVSENNTGADRKTEVAFNTKGQNGEPEICRVTITQTGEASVLDVLVTEVNLLPAGEEIRLPFVTNGTVDVRSSSDWCTVSVEDNDIVIMASANTGNARTAYVTASVNDGAGMVISKTVKVSQASDSFWLEMPVDVFTVSKDAGILEVSYLLKGEGVSVECVSNSEWVTIGNIAEGNIMLNISENNTGEKRDAEISLYTTGQNGVPVICKAQVTQLGEASVLDVLVTDVSLISSGEEIRVPFVTNGQVDIKSSSDWCSAAVSGSEIIIGADMNTQEDRTAYVTVMVTEDNGGVLARTIKVFQPVAPMNFEFENPVITLSYDASTGYAQLLSTGNWVLNNADSEIPMWLEISPTSGTGDAMLVIKVMKNQFNRERRTQLSFSNSLMNKSISLEVVQQENPNGIENYKYLGMGYDASGEYAMDSYVRNQILDVNELMNKGYIADVIDINSTDERYIYGRTYEEYQRNLSSTAGISANFLGFSSSVYASFSSASLSSQENEFSSFRHITKKQSYKVLANLKAEQLKECVIDYVQKDIDEMSPKDLFLKYGTHLVTGFVLGGSLDYSMSADVSVMSSSVDWSVSTRAGFKALSMGVTSSSEYSQYEKMTKEAANFESSLRARGGESQYASNNPNVSESTYNEWLASLSDPAKWVMVDYDGSKLIPIWEFASNASRRTELENAAKSYLAKPDINVSTTHRKVSIKLLKIGYLVDDPGDEEELSGDFWYEFDKKGETRFGSISLDIPDNMGSDPNSWPNFNGNVSTTIEKISILSDHIITLRGHFIGDDDSTPDDIYDCSLNFYYNTSDRTWRMKSENGTIISSGETFILDAGDLKFQLKFTWEL